LKKPVLSLEEIEPKKPTRADLPPSEGYVLVVDGHFKSEFKTVEAAEEAGGKLKMKFPKLQIQIYDAATRTRSALHWPPG
jgi:hypothetical protein